MGPSSRKIPMQKRDTKEKLNITFTKRRRGLFNKAAELSRLCDAQVAILVSAPNAKSYYTFSPTSVDAVLEPFLAGRAPERVSQRVTRDAHRLVGEIESLEAALLRATEFRKAAVSGRGGCPWANLRNYEESATTVEELQALHECLSRLRANYDPPSSSTASNVVSPAFSGRDDVITTAITPYVYNGCSQKETDSYNRTSLELDPIGCPPLGSSWMPYGDIGLDSESTDFVDSLWS